MVDLFDFFDEALRESYALLVAREAAGISAEIAVTQSLMMEIVKTIASDDPSLAGALTNVVDTLGHIAMRTRLLTEKQARPALPAAAFLDQPARRQ